MASEHLPSDERLVLRARRGNAQAFEALCVRYERLVRARARLWVVGSVCRRVSLRDVLQEAYLHAHEHLDDFDDRGEGAFGAWLAQIAEYKAREAVRRHAGVAQRNAAREVPRDLRPPTAQAPGHEPTPSQVAIHHEEADTVHAAMGTLSEAHRTVLELVQFDHQSLKEASVLMGRTYEATKKLYGRAVGALARALRRHATER